MLLVGFNMEVMYHHDWPMVHRYDWRSMEHFNLEFVSFLGGLNSWLLVVFVEFAMLFWQGWKTFGRSSPTFFWTKRSSHSFLDGKYDFQGMTCTLLHCGVSRGFLLTTQRRFALRRKVPSSNRHGGVREDSYDLGVGNTNFTGKSSLKMESFWWWLLLCGGVEPKLCLGDDVETRLMWWNQ